MQFRTFVTSTLTQWNKYLTSLYSGIRKGRIRLGTGRLLYPNLAFFTETDDHFIFELLGADKAFDSLKVFNHSYPSTVEYLGQFEGQEENPVFEFSARNNGISTLKLSNEVDLEAVKKRFGFINEQWKSHLARKGENGGNFSFSKSFQSCFINNCLIINRLEEIYRVKHILYAEIISKDFSETDYIADLITRHSKPVYKTDELFGIHYVENSSYQNYAISGQFANTFLLPQIRETRIGEFLNTHSSFICKALNYEDILYNKKFDWIEGNPNPDEKSIQPDLLLKKTDGTYDICDLKTALIEKSKITKGKHRRRQFIHYVDQGTSQLANYAEYFTFKKNADWAWSKYKVKVNNPRLILIVGNYENTNRDEVNEASRKLKSNYEIIDYDTLNALFLSSS